MKPGALPPRSLIGPAAGPGNARPLTPSSTAPAASTAPTPQTPTSAPPLAPLSSTASTAPRTAEHSGAPAWATPAYFHGLQKQAPSSSLTGGSGLNVRLGAMLAKPAPSTTATTAATTKATQRATGLSLLARAARSLGVVTGRPLTAAEIANARPALHLTRPEHVDSIMRDGLRPTTGVYKNLTTWSRSAVYMFEREPTAVQKFVNFSLQQSQATAVVEIDLTQLDPDKLYKRLVDNAIIYVSADPIPATALRVRDDGRR